MDQDRDRPSGSLTESVRRRLIPDEDPSELSNARTNAINEYTNSLRSLILDKMSVQLSKLDKRKTDVRAAVNSLALLEGDWEFNDAVDKIKSLLDVFDDLRMKLQTNFQQYEEAIIDYNQIFFKTVEDKIPTDEFMKEMHGKVIRKELKSEAQRVELFVDFIKSIVISFNDQRNRTIMADIDNFSSYMEYSLYICEDIPEGLIPPGHYPKTNLDSLNIARGHPSGFSSVEETQFALKHLIKAAFHRTCGYMILNIAMYFGQLYACCLFCEDLVGFARTLNENQQF